jgi:stearoyl-CoA desaturase (delta-9 desaturase)
MPVALDGRGHASRHGKPSITVENHALRAAQRRMALATILIPFLGTLAAVGHTVTSGIHALDIGLLVGMFILTSFGIEVGFHRYFAHRSFETGRTLRVALAILGSMAAEGSVLYWAAGHRRHHAHSDTGGDPHSPHIRNLESRDEPLRTLRGLWHSHIGWMMTDKVTNCTLFAKDILRDPTVSRIHRLYVPIVLLGLLLPAVVGGALSGTWTGALGGFLWGGLARMFLVHHSTWSNASFSHVYGGRPFAAGDLSANNFWCAVPTFGASWQNNHHMFPSSAFLGLEWWQIDIGALFIRALAALGVVWGVAGRPSGAMMAAKRVA